MNHPLDIKPDQVWTTRDGGKARIYATDGVGAFPIHGALWDTAKGGYHYLQAWTADGDRYGDRTAFARDLIRPYDWRADLAPIWAVLLPEYEWVAMDRDGRWWAYKKAPAANAVVWDGGIDSAFLPLRFPTPDCDWTETATQRPAEVGR